MSYSTKSTTKRVLYIVLAIVVFLVVLALLRGNNDSHTVKPLNINTPKVTVPNLTGDK